MPRPQKIVYLECSSLDKQPDQPQLCLATMSKMRMCCKYLRNGHGLATNLVRKRASRTCPGLAQVYTRLLDLT